MTEPTTMGAYLRACRRRRRISIERAAEDTRIRADFLMRMESDEFDYLAPAYVRGFLGSYARYLRVDPEPLLEEFDRRFGRYKTDSVQLQALQRNARSSLKEPRRFSTWSVAAFGSALVLAILAVIGLLSEPRRDPGPASDQVAEESPSVEPSPSPSSSPSASPSPSPDRGQDLAAADSFTLEVVAVREDCWIDVTIDGQAVFKDILAVGDRAGPFDFNDDLDLVLGNAYGVDLLINGQRIGPVGNSGEVKTISLPDDLDALI